MKALQIKVAREHITDNGKPIRFDPFAPEVAKKFGDVVATMEEFMACSPGDVELVYITDGGSEYTKAVRRWNADKGMHDDWISV